MPELGTKIVVMGTTCSGKTTTAKTLADRLRLEHIELDAINWQPNWTAIDENEFRRRADEATQGDRWVVDGNYLVTRDIVHPRAHSFVWLDIPLHVVLRRVFRRGMKRMITREELWNGNRESLYTFIIHKDNLFSWAIRTHRGRRRRYENYFAENRMPNVHRLRTVQDVNGFIESVSQ